jgi:peroxiredoxin
MRRPFIAIFLACLFFAGCSSLAPATGLKPGQLAPDFALTTLDGGNVSLSKFKGRVVVLDFWATWCSPCQQSLPHLQAQAANTDLARRGLVVLAVNEQESSSTIRAFMSEKHFTFTVARDTDGSTARDYSVETMPERVIIGRDGRVQAAFSGWTPDTAHQIDEAVNTALDAPVR